MISSVYAEEEGCNERQLPGAGQRESSFLAFDGLLLIPYE